MILKPLTKHIPSFFKDTTDFLRKLPRNTNKDIILTTFDVESLYSNITHELGLEALQLWINKHRNEIPSRFSDEFILESMEYILKNNTFKFNNIFFRQIRGTAMGTKVAPTFSTLTIAYLEDKLYKEVATTFGMSFSKTFIESWKRYLDDCFLLWTRTEEELLLLHKMLNNLNTHINFTMEFDRQELPFLDRKFIKDGEIIQTDIFYKPTDSKTYLLFSSCHSKHTKVNIPFSRF